MIRNKIRLVMTLLVRDEEDILEENICFHLNSGVDFIVAIDNGSIDGTTSILEKYKNLGVLEFEEIKEYTHKQHLWVSRMARRAAELGADYMFHCDADEFWYSKVGNLKKSILNESENVLYVPVLNYLPPSFDSSYNNIFNRFKFVVKKTELCPGEVEKRISSDLLFYQYPMKVITSSKFTNVGRGNDTIISKEKFSSKVTNKIVIHHFPIRGLKQFERKVYNGGSSYEIANDTDPSTGWHHKAWYKLFKKGKLSEEYYILNRSRNIERYLKNKIVEKAGVPLKIKYSKNIYNFITKVRAICL